VDITSEPVIVNKPAGEIFNFLKDFNNYRELMPEQVVRWESDETSGRFTIRDMAEIGMRIREAHPDDHVLIGSDGKVPFEFTLRMAIERKGDGQSVVQVFFDGEVSPFISMMARRPLTNLVNHMAERIRQLHE